VGGRGRGTEADERLVEMVVERERDPENRRPTGRDERRETSRVFSVSVSLSLSLSLSLSPSLFLARAEFTALRAQREQETEIEIERERETPNTIDSGVPISHLSHFPSRSTLPYSRADARLLGCYQQVTSCLR